MDVQVIISCVLYVTTLSRIIDLGPDGQWKVHKAEYGLSFGEEEEKVRKEIFLSNLNFIKDFNSQNRSSRLAMNHFGHLRPSEVNGHFSGTVELQPETDVITKPSLHVSGSMDWRRHGVITPVRNQGKCDASYAFSGVGAVESHFAIQTGVLQQFSAQEIIDCFHHFSARGCYGGFHDAVFEYAVNKGLSLESDYNYTGLNGTCKVGSKTHRHKILSYVMIRRFDEHELVRVLSVIGPVSVMVAVNRQKIMFYESGIIDHDYCDDGTTGIKLEVLAVGYDKEFVKPYLIVKHSWGESWGEKGYFRIALFNNMCSVAAIPSYPVVKLDKI